MADDCHDWVAGDPTLPRPPVRRVLHGAAPQPGRAHDGRPRLGVSRVGHALQDAGAHTYIHTRASVGPRWPTSDPASTASKWPLWLSGSAYSTGERPRDGAAFLGNPYPHSHVRSWCTQAFCLTGHDNTVCSILSQDADPQVRAAASCRPPRAPATTFSLSVKQKSNRDKGKAKSRTPPSSPFVSTDQPNTSPPRRTNPDPFLVEGCVHCQIRAL